MNDILKRKLLDIDPYVPGEQPKIENIIKLNTNECPYPPSPKALKALKEIDGEKLNLYPDFVCRELKEILCENYPVKPDEVFLGNGSDEVLALCFKAFFNSSLPVLFPDISYSFYKVWTELFGIPYRLVPLNDDFTLNADGFFAKNGGVVIPNPNAPTAIYEPKKSIEEIIKRNSESVVIIDEAYVDFSDEGSIADLIHKYDNLVVVQTYSKSRALAGIRLGCAYANRELIATLEAVKNSFNSYTVNTVTRILAEESGRDREYFNETIAKIKNTRSILTELLVKEGFSVCPSSANFVFATHTELNITDLFEYLKTKGIFVRHFNDERIKNYLRITVGTDEQIEALMRVIKEYMGKNE